MGAIVVDADRQGGSRSHDDGARAGELEELLHGHTQVAVTLALSVQPGYSSGREETKTKVEAGPHYY